MDRTEISVHEIVADFLNGTEGFDTEIQRRRRISKESEASLIRELRSLKKNNLDEIDAEARAFRLATRGKVSEEVLNQEVGLIRTRQRWISEQRQRLEENLSEIRRFSFDPKQIEKLRLRLETKLEAASTKDWRFILNALGVNVLVREDGNWELELQVPREDSPPDWDLQIANSRPESNSA